MAFVDERSVHPEDVMLVPGIVRGVELLRQLVPAILSTKAYQFQDGYFHLALVQIRRLILDNLDGKELVRSHILTFDDLSKRTLTQNIQNQVSEISLAQDSWLLAHLSPPCSPPSTSLT